MNGTSGFHEVRSSTSRSPAYRFLYEHRHQLGTGAWPPLRAHDLITLFTGISAQREQVSDTFFMQPHLFYQELECTLTPVL